MSKVILFQGVNASGKHGLWISDGTGAGTVELTGLSGVSSKGISPEFFRLLGQKIFFQGLDSAGHEGLWSTDGTAKGTTELTVTGASTSGLDPTKLTSFGKDILFNGVDTAGHQGLWVTDGTAAGTKEITVAGAATGGLDPTNGGGDAGSFAVIGKEAYFAGADTSGKVGLWKTDGTSAGTTEVTAVGGTVDPVIIRSLGTKLVFSGKTATATDLYTSDGTAAGTHAITGITGARTDANGGIAAQDMRHFGSKILFSGVDAAGKRGLWVTDGTGAGTTELKSFGSSPQGITRLGDSSAMFAVKNTSGGYDLWVTDGTATGTKELTGITGANVKGILDGSSYPQLVSYHGDVYFSGHDANGDITLWETDGTAAGTKEVTGITGGGTDGLDPGHFANVGRPGTSSSSSSGSKTDTSGFAAEVAHLSHALFDAHFGGAADIPAQHFTKPLMNTVGELFTNPLTPGHG